MQELPRQYLVARFDAPGEPLTTKLVDLRLPSTGELLLKVLACGVCHTDELVRSGVFGNTFPRVPGHEIIGEIVRTSDEELTWNVGDRVGAAWHGGSDGNCMPCKKGMSQMCANGETNGCTRDGGYAEYVNVRSDAVVRIPHDVDPVQFAPLLCAGVTTFAALKHVKIELGETIAVHGLGGLGHLAVQYARKSGYRVIAISSSNAKRELAMKLGAHDYIDGSKGDVADQLQKSGGAACIILTAPNPALIQLLLKGLEPLGKLLIVAAAGPGELNTTVMIPKGLSIVAWPSGSPLDCEAALDFAKMNDVNCMVEKFPLDRANEALERMSSGKVRFRSVLVPEGR